MNQRCGKIQHKFVINLGFLRGERKAYAESGELTRRWIQRFLLIAILTSLDFFSFFFFVNTNPNEAMLLKTEINRFSPTQYSNSIQFGSKNLGSAKTDGQKQTPYTHIWPTTTRKPSKISSQSGYYNNPIHLNEKSIYSYPRNTSGEQRQGVRS